MPTIWECDLRAIEFRLYPQLIPIFANSPLSKSDVVKARMSFESTGILRVFLIHINVVR